jgi:hypothetical protein
VELVPRVANELQFRRPWRIHEVLGDFPLEDLWHLPQLTGTAEEFDDLIALIAGANPAVEGPVAVRFLWNTRDLLGTWFGLGTIASAVPEPPADSLMGSVPEDLRGSAAGIRFASLPFHPLYRTDTEFAAEVANRTMHGVMHLGWIDQGDGTYFPQMAVYVRPNGWFGRAYMQFIKPFRYVIVYPALEKHLLTLWQARNRAR